MTTPYYDIRDGALLVGEAAVEARTLGAHASIFPLRSILVATDFPFENSEFPKADVENWEREDYILFGRWVMNVMAEGMESSQELGLERETLRRLYVLGLGPSGERLKYRFGRHREFCEVIGSRAMHVVGKYDEWAFQDFVNFAANLAITIGRKPGFNDYARESRKGNGPSQQQIIDRVGGVKALNEFIGYPNILEWSFDDYIEWGVKVMMANNGTLPGRRLLTILSQRKRGPSVSTIVKKFTSFTKFTAEIESAFIQEETELRQHYDELVDEGLGIDNPAVHEYIAKHSSAHSARFVAKYRLAQILVPGLSSNVLTFLAKQGTSFYTYRLKILNPRLTTGEMETEAVSCNFFDDIWPLDEWRTYLHVSLETLGYTRERDKRRFYKSDKEPA